MTLDLTGIATATIAGIFAILGIVIPLLLNARIKDAQAATVLGAAVKNSLGALEQAATLSVATLKPAVTIPGVPSTLQVGVQYVLDHAGDEAARFGLTPAALADKVSAQIGLQKIAVAVVAKQLPAVVLATAPAAALPPRASAALPTRASAGAAAIPPGKPFG